LLMEQLNYNLLFRWFVGLEIDDVMWNHAVFSKNRDRLLNHDRQRLPQVIRASRESIIENWLQAVKQDSEIGSIPIPDSERKEHMLLILEAATGVVEGKELTAEGRKAYLRQGAIRYRENRTVSLLIREGKLLQASLADCILRQFAAIEMNYLVSDTIRLMATIDGLLQACARGFIRQANAERVASRRRGERNIPESKAG